MTVQEFAQKIFSDVREMSKSALGVTRLGYTEKETEVLRYLESTARNLGLACRYDVAGNLWMTLRGKNPNLPGIMVASHADSVPEGGNFDGLAGIVAGLCAAKDIQDSQRQLQQDLNVVAFRCEEQGLIGSRAILGTLKAEDLQRRYRPECKLLGESMQDCGIDPQALVQGKAYLGAKDVAAYFELHIEQGPKLELSDQAKVGLVTGIRGNVFHRSIRCVGETAHSGAIDFEFRHDAVAAVAELFSAMRSHWIERLKAGEDLVYTNGVVNTPASQSFNIIAGEVTFSLDIRTLSVETRQAFYICFKEEAEKVEKRFGVKFEFDEAFYIEPSLSNPSLVEKLEQAAAQEAVPVIRMASGAGHDAGDVAQQGIPMAMIFVANQNGSHNWREAMRMEDLLAAVRVLTRALKNFS